MENEIKGGIAGGLAGLASYMAGVNWELIVIWFALMCMDVGTGVVYSAKNGEFQSNIMKKGLLTKVGEFFLMFALLLIQRVALINGINVPIASTFIGAFCFKEFASIFETATKSGVQVPAAVKKWLKVAHEEMDDKE